MALLQRVEGHLHVRSWVCYGTSVFSHSIYPKTTPANTQSKGKTRLPQRLGVALRQALHRRLGEVRQHAARDERGHLLREQVLRQPLCGVRGMGGGVGGVVGRG